MADPVRRTVARTPAVRTPVSTMLTSRRAVDLCRQRSCLCRGGNLPQHAA